MSAVFATGIVMDYLRGYKPSVNAFKPFSAPGDYGRYPALSNELIYITRDLPQEWADKGLWIPYRKTTAATDRS